MAKIKRVHCNLKHLDAYLIEREDGQTTIRCPQRPYCSECPIEKEILHKK
ncbi:MAG: hypothetical protein QW717_04585 [Candidatus Bathyarchaeia archaeon]